MAVLDNEPPAVEVLSAVEAYLSTTLAAVNADIDAGTFDPVRIWIDADCAPILTPTDLSPVPFYRPDIVVWLPALRRPHLRLQCPTCLQANCADKRSWAIHRVVDVDTCYYICSHEFECQNAHCPSASDVFSSADPDVVSMLPPEMQSAFPGITLGPDGIMVSRRVADLIASVTRAGMTVDQVRQTLHSVHLARYAAKKAAFESAAASALRQARSTKGSRPEAFSTFSDATGFAGFVPSAAQLLPACSGPIVVTATATAPLHHTLASVCASATCSGFASCRTCQSVQMTSVRIESPQSAAVSVLAAITGSTKRPASSDFTFKCGKRPRRPRRCQHRQMVNGAVVVCGLTDCPGRGGRQFCTSFDGSNSNRAKIDDAPTSKPVAEDDETDDESTALDVQEQTQIDSSELLAITALENLL